MGLDLVKFLAAVEHGWGLDTGGWSVLVDGAGPVVRLPAADAALHISRAEVGPARVEALDRARARLADCGLPVVELMTSLTGSTWHLVQGRVIQVERWVDHDGRMNSWATLRMGCALLADVHNAWSGLELGPEGEACAWANWISPTEVVDRCDIAARRLRRWALHSLADDVVRLAELTVDHRALPTQVVHGDFWDNNVYLRRGQIVAISDFEFLGRRPRIDDLALLLYFADEQPFFEGAGARDAPTRRAELAPLVRAYADQLAAPLTDDEMAALPIALARQPLWTYGVWLIAQTDDDRDNSHARSDAMITAPSVARALEIMSEPDRWTEALASI